MKEKVNYKPLNKNLLVVSPTIPEKTEAGIIKSKEIIAEEKKKMDMFLEVAATADDVTTVKVGDKVLVLGSQKEVDIDGVAYLLVHEAGLYGKRIK